MLTCKLHGQPPFRVAVIHGGPGAAGTVNELARLLSVHGGVLEPIQTQDSIAGQLEELKQTLDCYAKEPVTLIGHSWGAMLAYLFTSQHPNYVKKLMMVGSGLFDPSYVPTMNDIRANRMTEDQRKMAHQYEEQLSSNDENADVVFSQYGDLIGHIDAFDPFDKAPNEPMKGQFHIYTTVWPEAVKMRESGALLRAGSHIQCPVIAIHGTHDPHPYQGIKNPLEAVIRDFTFILLEKCGHEPWIEKQAKEIFLNLLEKHICHDPHKQPGHKR